MKKTFLFFSLAILISALINILENNGQSDSRQILNSTNTDLSDSSLTASSMDDNAANNQDSTDTDLADSFLTAFGMDDNAEDNQDSTGSISTGLSTISTISTNQVTPPFTPHQKQK